MVVLVLLVVFIVIELIVLVEVVAVIVLVVAGFVGELVVVDGLGLEVREMKKSALEIMSILQVQLQL